MGAAAGENRITGMIEGRPDWVLSRQRAWGVPIAVFARENGDGSAEILNDDAVNARIAAAFEQEGADAWYTDGARERFLGSLANEAAKRSTTFSTSGSIPARPTPSRWRTPSTFRASPTSAASIDGGADTVMYLEGSDQHRGWFQSSLLESCGTRGRAPFDVVLTHGFTLDENGRKMSKSLGNTVEPQKVIEQSGADILRLWVCATDYADDQRIGPEILKTTVETYRKLRNTIRWMLGTLPHFTPGGRGGARRHAGTRAADAASACRTRRRACARPTRSSTTRRVVAALTPVHDHRPVGVLFRYPQGRALLRSALLAHPQGLPDGDRRVFRTTVIWLAPMLCFTAEEAFRSRYPDDNRSVHLEPFPDIAAGLAG